AGAIAGRVISLRSLFSSAMRISADREIRELQLDSLPVWARSEVARHDVRHLLEAGAESGRFDLTGWLREIDWPTTGGRAQRDRRAHERGRDPARPPHPALPPARGRRGDPRRARAQDPGRTPVVRVS